MLIEYQGRLICHKGLICEEPDLAVSGCTARGKSSIMRQCEFMKKTWGAGAGAGFLRNKTVTSFALSSKRQDPRRIFGMPVSDHAGQQGITMSGAQELTNSVA